MAGKLNALSQSHAPSTEPLYYWSDDAEVIRSDGFETREHAYSDAFTWRAECFDDPSQNDRFFLHHGHMVKCEDFDPHYAPSEDNVRFVFEGKTEEVLSNVVLDYFHDQWAKLSGKQINAMPDRHVLTKKLLKLPDDDPCAHQDFIKQNLNTLAAALDDTVHIQFADNGFVRLWQEQPFDGSEAFDTGKLIMLLGTYNYQAQQRAKMLEDVQHGLRQLQEKFPCVNTNHVDYRCEAYRIACEMLNDISKVLPLPLFDNLKP